MSVIILLLYETSVRSGINIELHSLFFRKQRPFEVHQLIYSIKLFRGNQNFQQIQQDAACRSDEDVQISWEFVCLHINDNWASFICWWRPCETCVLTLRGANFIKVKNHHTQYEAYLLLSFGAFDVTALLVSISNFSLLCQKLSFDQT